VESPLELCLLQAAPAGASLPSAEGEESEEELSGREQEAAWVAERVRELLDSGRLVGDREARCWRPVEPRDIAVLFQAMTDVGLYERALQDAGVPTYVVAGRGFYAAQEVRDLTNGLRALENPLDEVALVGALRSPLFGVSDEALFWLSRLWGTWQERLAAAGGLAGPVGGEGEPLDHLASDDRARLALAARVLADLQARKNRLSLAELAQELLARTGFGAALAAQFGGDRMVSNVRKVVDLAGEFEGGEIAAGAGFGLRDFVDFVRGMSVREVREQEAPVEEEAGQAVRLMTVHGAKGLEWPVVFVVDLARQRRADSDPFRWHPHYGLVAREGAQDKTPWPAVGELIRRQEKLEQEAEWRRLFYVAATRARDLLVLSASLKLSKPKKENEPAGWPSQATDGPLGWLDRGLVGQVRSLAGESPRVELQWEGEGFTPRPVTEALSAQDADSRPAAEAATDVEPRLALVEPVAPDAAQRQRFTATELATYHECPRRYLLENLLGLPAGEPAFLTPQTEVGLSALELGDLVHHVLRVAGSDGEAGVAEALATTDGTPRLDARLDRRAGEKLNDIRQRAMLFVSSDLYAEVVAPARRLRSEMLLTFPLAEAEAEARAEAVLEGRVDALLEDAGGDLHLLDYKIASRHLENEAGYRLQLGLYCHGIQAATGRMPATARIVYLASDHLQVSALTLPGDAETAAAQATAVIRGIRAGEYPRTQAQCEGCPLRWRCGETE
jgi:ATP-dependent helicase/nuclease subunit A